MSIVSFLVSRLSNFEAPRPLKTRLKKLFNNLLYPSLLSLFVFATLCIFLFLIFDLVPIPNATYCKPFSNSITYNALFQLYGAILQFSFMGFFLWVCFTQLNLLLMLCFPFAFAMKLRLRVVIYLIQSLVSIVIPLFLVCLTLALGEGSPYRVYINILI